MHKTVLLTLWLVAALAAACTPGNPSRSPAPAPVDGLLNDGLIASYYRAHASLAGAPLTLAQERSIGDRRMQIQAFEGLVLAYALDGWNPQVRPLPISRDLGCAAAAPVADPARPEMRYFPQTGHTSSYAFLAVFDRDGGAEVLGYPIDEPHQENGRLVQCFENARLEWWPENAPAQRVVATPLGRIYAQFLEQPPSGPVSAMPGATATRKVDSLHVTVAVAEWLVAAGAEQTVIVLVEDQAEQPVAGANVQINIAARSDSQGHVDLVTDASGLVHYTFISGAGANESAVIAVVASYGDGSVVGAAQTSYLGR
jgi:hypothetical protein